MSISIPIVRHWHIKTPELYRYLEQEYVDDFFKTGRLRLNSFQGFAKHPDEQRGDPEEGRNVLAGFGQNFTTLILTQQTHALILSTSTKEDKDLMTTLGYNGYFRIKDSTNFAAAVAGRIPGFVQGFEGFCIYTDQRIIRRQLPQLSLDDLKTQPEDKFSLDKAFAIAAQIGSDDVFFIKHSSLRDQNEYRFVWNVRYPVEDALFAECPEAIQFCEKVT